MTDHDITFYCIILIGSFIAGIINTLAGNGSVITLSLLTDMIGLPPNVANGTNRVGIFLGSLGNGVGFYQNHLFAKQESKTVFITTTIGALFGVIVATKVSNAQFLVVFKYTMVMMLVIILIKPSRWLAGSNVRKLSPVFTIPFYLLLGFYGGFIQMGVGIILVAVLVLISGYNIIEANAIKTPIIAIYTGLVIIIFAYKGLIDWHAGLLVAAGQTVGGYFMALYAPRWPNSNIWTYRLLVAVVILAILIQFKIL